MAIDEKTRTELEAAAFRRLLTHLRERNDVGTGLHVAEGRSI